MVEDQAVVSPTGAFLPEHCLSLLCPCRSKKNDMTTADETRRPMLTLQFKRSLKLHDPKHMQWRTVVQREVRLVVHTMNICKRKFSALSILRSFVLSFSPCLVGSSTTRSGRIGCAMIQRVRVLFGVLHNLSLSSPLHMAISEKQPKSA